MHFARIKYKQIAKDGFKIWAEAARKFPDGVLNETIDLVEYEDWLKR